MSKSAVRYWWMTGPSNYGCKNVRGEDVICKVVVGGTGTRKGCSGAGMPISEPFLTANLRENLDFAIQQQPDYIALSFVTGPEDVEQVRDILKKQRRLSHYLQNRDGRSGQKFR